MEDEATFNRSAFANPSVDPLDAAIADMEKQFSGQATAPERKTETDPEKDETTSNVTTAEDVPEDDDLEDDVRTDAANTPETDDEDEDDDSQESRQQQKPAQKSKASTSEANVQAEGDSDEDDPPLSRKQRGKLIAELRQELEREQQERARLEESLKAQREADEKLKQEVDRALGTEEDYEKALADGLRGDTKQAERARIWKANRDFYTKLLDKSKADAMSDFVTNYWSNVNGLPGVTQEALQAPNLADILKNMYDAGVASVKDSESARIEKLQEEVDTWKGRYKSLKAKAGSTRTSPLAGGGGTAVEKTSDPMSKWIDPKTGLFTDEADAIVARHGFEALTNPKLRKG